MVHKLCTNTYMYVYSLVVVDEDEDFINSFERYIHKKREEYKIMCFTTKEFFTTYAPKDADILIISSKLYFQEIKDYQFKNIIILQDGEEEESYSLPVVKKFQPITLILRDIKIICNEKKVGGINKNNIERSKIITFYSPIGGSGTTTISLGTAVVLSRVNYKVLYLNLEEIQSTKAFFQCENSRKNIAYLSCYAKEDSLKFKDRLSLIVKRDEITGIDYFLPFENILDMETVVNNIDDLLKKVKEINLYDYIIVDLGLNTMTACTSVFNNSDNIFLILLQNMIGKIKGDSLLRQMEQKDRMKLLINKFEEEMNNYAIDLVKEYSIPLVSRIPIIREISESSNINHWVKNNEFNDNIKQIIFKNIIE